MTTTLHIRTHRRNANGVPDCRDDDALHELNARIKEKVIPLLEPAPGALARFFECVREAFPEGRVRHDSTVTVYRYEWDREREIWVFLCCAMSTLTIEAESGAQFAVQAELAQASAPSKQARKPGGNRRGERSARS